MNRSLLLCLLFTLALRVAFLNQAIQGDDVYYLAGAEHAQIDPLHPHHARYAFEGRIVDMRGHPHPPLNSWILAGLLAFFGDVYEVWFHTAYMAFSLLAVGAVWWIARRFHAPPISALLVAVMPAFVISGTSLEADPPLLAFLMCGMALFVRGVDDNSGVSLAASALAFVLASMTGYQAILVTPILALYLWFNANRRWGNWLVVAAPVVTIAAWQLYERVTSGRLPLAVLHGYTSEYGLESFEKKVRSALALTVHAGWIVFPVLAVIAFWPRRRVVLGVIVVASACLAVLDYNPLFWASFGIGLMVLSRCVSLLWSRDIDERFLAAWAVVFFAGALAGAFAGSERYLLPIAAPVAILTGRFLAARPRWLFAGFAAQCCVSLALAMVNYQHWNGYRQFVARHRDEIQSHRTWVASEWGLRFYAESQGALPMLIDTRMQDGDLVLGSALSGGALARRSGLILVDERAIVPALPLRLIGLHARSGFSTASEGLREFDITTEPVDIVRLQRVMEREPTVSWLPMNAPAAAYQIVEGAYGLESGTWRWVSATSAFRLLTPPNPARFAAELFVPPQVTPCTVTLSVNDSVIATAKYAASGKYELSGAIAGALAGSVTTKLTTDRTFRAPHDARDLGLVLIAIGFTGPSQ
jgi:hypothetical protein